MLRYAVLLLGASLAGITGDTDRQAGDRDRNRVAVLTPMAPIDLPWRATTIARPGSSGATIGATPACPTAPGPTSGPALTSAPGNARNSATMLHVEVVIESRDRAAARRLQADLPRARALLRAATECVARSAAAAGAPVPRARLRRALAARLGRAFPGTRDVLVTRAAIRPATGE